MFELTYFMLTKTCSSDGFDSFNQIDGMDAFWEYMYLYSMDDMYPLDPKLVWVKWLIENKIPFTLEITSMEELFSESHYLEELVFNIKIPNPKDAMFFKLRWHNV